MANPSSDPVGIELSSSWNRAELRCGGAVTRKEGDISHLVLLYVGQAVGDGLGFWLFSGYFWSALT